MSIQQTLIRGNVRNSRHCCRGQSRGTRFLEDSTNLTESQCTEFRGGGKKPQTVRMGSLRKARERAQSSRNTLSGDMHCIRDIGRALMSSRQWGFSLSLSLSLSRPTKYVQTPKLGSTGWSFHFRKNEIIRSHNLCNNGKLWWWNCDGRATVTHPVHRRIV